MIEKQSDNYKIKSIDELHAVALVFLKKFPNGGIFRVEGDMGAGKTTFIGEICRCLGLQFLGSPTFSLVNEYELDDGRMLYHFDLYRLKSTEEIQDIGITEYLDQGKFVFIEWPEKAEPFLQSGTNSISIRDEDGVRSVSF